jgi:serine acetyltransferase
VGLRPSRTQSLAELIRTDWRSNAGYNLDAIKARVLLLEYRLEQATYHWHLSHSTPVSRAGWNLCRFVGSVFQWLLFSCQISGMVEAGPGLRLPHPQNIIVGMTTRLGGHCSLYHNVTFARSTLKQGVRLATVGDRVVVGAGVTVMGAVTIGDDAIIAAGAVVTKDVPAATMVISAPVEMRQRKDVGADGRTYPNPHPLARTNRR